MQYRCAQRGRRFDASTEPRQSRRGMTCRRYARRASFALQRSRDNHAAECSSSSCREQREENASTEPRQSRRGMLTSWQQPNQRITSFNGAATITPRNVEVISVAATWPIWLQRSRDNHAAECRVSCRRRSSAAPASTEPRQSRRGMPDNPRLISPAYSRLQRSRDNHAAECRVRAANRNPSRTGFNGAATITPRNGEANEWYVFRVSLLQRSRDNHAAE